MWFSQERKKLLKWNRKHFSRFHNSSFLDLKNKIENMYRTQALKQKSSLTLPPGPGPVTQATKRVNLQIKIWLEAATGGVL